MVSVPPVVSAFLAHHGVSVSSGSVHCSCVGKGGEMFSSGNMKRWWVGGLAAAATEGVSGGLGYITRLRR
jgi:hypothetical protein